MQKKVLSVGERIMYVQQAQTVNCLFPVSITGDIQPSQVKKALTYIQQKHPLLRAIVEENDGIPTFVVQAEPAPIPIIAYERRSDVYWEEISAQHWHQHMDVQKGPLMQLVWIRGEQKMEFILICPHCIADGVSMTTLMREFLQLLDNADIATQELPQQLITAIDLPKRLTRIKRLSFAIKGGIGRTVAHALLPKKRDEHKLIDRKAAYMLHNRLDEDAMNEIRHYCKLHGISLYAWVAAVFLKTFRITFPKKAKGKLICPVDMRKFVSSIKHDQLFAFAPIMDLKMAQKEQTTLDLARQIKGQISMGLKKMDIAGVLHMNEHFQSVVPKLLNHLMTTEGSHDFTCSNMGKLAIPDQFRSFTVDAIYSPSVVFPWRNPHTLVMSSYNHVLDFTFMSNEQVLPLEQAREFMNQSLQALVIQ